MATWQCDFYIVPRARAPGWEEAWAGLSPAGDWAGTLNRLLPQAKSWHPALQVWGTDEGHRVDAWSRHGGLESLLIRIDVRADGNDLHRMCDGVANLARTCGDTVLVSPSGLVIEASAEALEEVVCASAAMRYVEDPAAYLRRVELGGPEDA